MTYSLYCALRMTLLGRIVLCVLAVNHFGTAQLQGSNVQTCCTPHNIGLQTVNVDLILPALNMHAKRNVRHKRIVGKDVDFETVVQGWSKPTNSQTTDVDSILPALNICGKRNVRHKRIVGGIDSDLGTFPWITALGYRNYTGEKPLWLCAGSLVTERHVITAAQCFVWAPSGYVLSVARLGELDLDETVQDNAVPVDYEVESFITHPMYNFRTSINNIAIIRLKDKVTFTINIRPICLPTEDQLKKKSFTGYYADVTGWGETEYPGRRSSHLHRTTVEVWDQQACVDTYTPKGVVIDQTMVCAGGKDKNTCYADVGGPLMVRYSAASRRPLVNHYLYGIVSHGHQCGNTGDPGVYTRVSEFMDWILQNLN